MYNIVSMDGTYEDCDIQNLEEQLTGHFIKAVCKERTFYINKESIDVIYETKETQLRLLK